MLQKVSQNHIKTKPQSYVTLYKISNINIFVLFTEEKRIITKCHVQIKMDL